jgi:hypothetical protein
MGNDRKDPVARGQCDAETGQQFGNVAIRTRYGWNDELGLHFAPPHRLHDVHAFDGADLLDEFPRTGSKAFAAHPLFEHSPHRHSQKADEDLGFDPVGFVVVDRAQFKVALGGSKRRFGFGQRVRSTRKAATLTSSHCAAGVDAALAGDSPSSG